MRKVSAIVAILIVGILAASVACSASPASPSPTPQAAKPTAVQPQQPAAVKWKGQTYMPIADMGPGHYSAILPKALNEITGGRLSIEFAPPASIFPIPETIQNLGNGTVDIAFSYGSYYAGVMPETDIEVGLPFAWSTLQEEWAAYYNPSYGLLNELRKVYGQKGVYFLAPAFAPTKYALMSNVRMDRPGDMKGKKIRAVGLQADLVSYLGGTPVPLDAKDMYMGLKTGTVDAEMAGILGAEGLKLQEVSKYFIGGFDTGMIVASMLVSQKSWNALPDDLKRLVETYTKHVLDEYALEYFEPGLVRTWTKKYGIEYIDWSESDVAPIRDYAIKTVWQKTADKNPNNARLVEIVRQQMRDLGKLK